jgi:hypothetical protein
MRLFALAVGEMSSRRAFLAGVGGLAGPLALSRRATAAAAPTLTWERTYAPADSETALVRDVVPTADGFVLVGLAGSHDRYRGWIGGVDAAGRSRWHRRKGTGRSALLAATPAAGDADGVLAAGVTNLSTDRPAVEHGDPYVVRAGPHDGVAWARTYQPAAPDGRASAVARVADGYVVAGGEGDGGHDRPWAAHVDARGTRRWTWRGDRAGDVNAAAGVPGGAVLGGSTRPPGADVPAPRGSQEAAWVAELTAGGAVAWRWRVDRERGDRVEGLARSPDGGVVAVGRRGFSADDRGVGWLVALDGTGRRRWERTYPRTGWNWHRDVASTGEGYVLAGTREEGPDADARGAWLLFVDAAGEVVREYRAERGTRGVAVHALPDGGVLVGGESSSAARSRTEGWLAKLGGDPAPEPRGGGGPTLPSVPDWTAPLLAGGTLGALAASVASRWRRS